MRLKPEEMEKRANYVKEFVQKHPDTKVAAVNEAVKKKFGSGMTPTRISDLIKTTNKSGARHEDEAVPQEVTREDEVAARGNNGANTGGNNGTNVAPIAARSNTAFRSAEGTEGESLKISSASTEDENRAVEAATGILKGIGATNIHITYTISRKMDA